MKYEPADGTWVVLPHARGVLKQIRSYIGNAAYEQTKVALQEFLCLYFNAGPCIGKQGNSISPIASTLCPGGKCLKVRWALPGSGKSGGLRLAVVVYCEERVVKIAGAWVRKDDPEDPEFNHAFSLSTRS